jgi:hypothetical protein
MLGSVLVSDCVNEISGWHNSHVRRCIAELRHFDECILQKRGTVPLIGISNDPNSTQQTTENILKLQTETEPNVHNPIEEENTKPTTDPQTIETHITTQKLRKHLLEIKEV